MPLTPDARSWTLALLLAAGAFGSTLRAEPPAKAGAGGATEDVITPEGVLLRFDEVEMSTVADLYGRITGKIVIPSPQLKGKVTILNRERLNPTKAASLIESALELQGWSFIPQGDVTKLVKSKDAVKREVRTVVTRGEGSLENVSRVQTHLVKLQQAKAEDVKNLVTPLLSDNGTIQVNERTNLLVVTEVSSNMARLLELIEQVDRPLTREESYMEMIHLRHVTPVKMLETIKGYFKEGEVKFLPDERLQVLVVRGPERLVREGRAIIGLLDQAVPKAQHQNQIIRIRYAKAADVAALIEKLYKGQTADGQAGAAGGQSAGAATQAPFSINADNDSNTIILTGPTELRDEIRALVDNIDIRYQQVLIKILIGELNNSPQETFGFQWGRLVGSTNELAQDFGAIGLSDERTEVRTSTPGIRYSLLRPNDLSGFVNMLEIQTDFNILASPHITVSDNKPAEFQVGSRVPVQTAQRISTGNDIVNSNEYVDTGLTMKLVPSITPDSDVAMDVDLKFSDQIGNNPGFVNPVFSNRTFKTSVIVKDSHTLVIAGLMQRSLDQTVNKVPFVADLPIVGFLFRQTNSTERKQELLVMLTPSVIDDQRDATELTSAYEARSFLDEQWKEYGEEWRASLDYMKHVYRKTSSEPRIPLATMITGRYARPAGQTSPRPETGGAGPLPLDGLGTNGGKGGTAIGPGELGHPPVLRAFEPSTGSGLGAQDGRPGDGAGIRSTRSPASTSGASSRHRRIEAIRARLEAEEESRAGTDDGRAGSARSGRPASRSGTGETPVLLPSLRSGWLGDP